MGLCRGRPGLLLAGGGSRWHDLCRIQRSRALRDRFGQYEEMVVHHRRRGFILAGDRRRRHDLRGIGGSQTVRVEPGRNPEMVLQRGQPDSLFLAGDRRRRYDLRRIGRSQRIRRRLKASPLNTADDWKSKRLRRIVRLARRKPGGGRLARVGGRSVTKSLATLTFPAVGPKTQGRSPSTRRPYY